MSGKRNLNICIITFEYPPTAQGGVGSSTYRIAKNLALAGLNLHVVAPGPHHLAAAVRPVQEEGVIVHRTLSRLSSLYRNHHEKKEVGNYIVNLHKKVDFDLIHSVFLVPPGHIGAIVAKEIGCPLIVSIRGSDIEAFRYSPELLVPLKWVLEEASFVTSVNSELLRKAEQITTVQDSRVILNAFDASLFDSRSLREIAENQTWRFRLFVERLLRIKSKGELVIGTAGNIRPVKGFPFLIEAFKNLLSVTPEAHLLVVGDFYDPDEKRRWVKRIIEMGLKRKVTFTGWVPHSQVLAWMCEMDIFAFPSLHEGLPNALLEAMASGLPVVASNVSGIVDLVTDGKNGLLVPPNSVETLAEKLKTLISDASLRRQLGKSARKTVEDRFSPERETTEWMDVYGHVVSEYQRKLYYT